MSVSNAASTPACRGVGAHTNVYCWIFVIAPTIAAGPAQ
jgi:hypothetical protein